MTSTAAPARVMFLLGCGARPVAGRRVQYWRALIRPREAWLDTAALRASAVEVAVVPKDGDRCRGKDGRAVSDVRRGLCEREAQQEDRGVLLPVEAAPCGCFRARRAKRLQNLRGT